MKNLKKIHICGTNGSGKTTLGKLISQKLKLPFYPLEDVKYITKFTKKRSEKEMRKRVKEISLKKEWVTEECWADRAEELFKKADLIILLRISKKICQFRVLKRFFTRKKQENDTLKQAIRICRKVGRYEKDKHPVSLHAQEKLIKKYNKKVIIIKKQKDINNLLEELK